MGGEWSLVETLRHLKFAMDNWFTLPILGGENFHPIGLPNTGSLDFGWPGLDRRADLENGSTPVNECLSTLFEEEFEHNRYAGRDLAHLE